MPDFNADHYLLPSPLARRIYAGILAPLPIEEPALAASALSESGKGHTWLEHLQQDGIFHQQLQRLGISMPEGEDPEPWMQAVLEVLKRTPGSSWFQETHLLLSQWLGIDAWLTDLSAKDLSGLIDQEGLPTIQGWLDRTEVRTLGLLTGGDVDLPGLLSRTPEGVSASPVFSPDAFLQVQFVGVWNAYLNELAQKSGTEIEHFIDLLHLLRIQVDTFHEQGCRLAQQDVVEVPTAGFSDEEINFLFHKLRLRHALTPHEADQLTGAIQYHLAEMYHEKGWTLRLRLGIQLSRGDSMNVLLGQQRIPARLMQQLDSWDERAILPATVLVPMLPVLFPACARLIQDAPPQSMRWGLTHLPAQGHPALTHQWETLLSQGLIHDTVPFSCQSTHVWGLVRHDLFRRRLAQWMAGLVQTGELPEDEGLLTRLTLRLCGYR